MIGCKNRIYIWLSCREHRDLCSDCSRFARRGCSWVRLVSSAGCSSPSFVGTPADDSVAWTGGRSSGCLSGSIPRVRRGWQPRRRGWRLYSVLARHLRHCSRHCRRNDARPGVNRSRVHCVVRGDGCGVKQAASAHMNLQLNSAAHPDARETHCYINCRRPRAGGCER